MRQTDNIFIQYFQKFFLGVIRPKNVAALLGSISTIYLIFYTSSCANTGSPTGGPKDSIPPVVVKTIPELRSTNYSGSDIRITFDEYIISDAVSEKMVVSPPLKKKPQIKMKGKTLIVDFPEGLKKGKTYSVDFKDAVADNNEKNPIKDLRFSFSTGASYDSLRVSGFVIDALSLEPLEKTLVALYHQNDFLAFADSIPDYIGKTDETGRFLIDNVAPGTYRLYALSDADNSLTYNSKAEKIAFCDSLIVPSAQFVAHPDTIVSETDTVVVSGHVDYSPGLQYLRMFEEESFDQFLNDSKRTQGNRCDFYFAESLEDSFQVNLISPVPGKDWKFLEPNIKRDSITVWLTDTLISNTDTLKFSLKYNVLDSLNQLVVKHDTVELVYSQPKALKSKRKKDEKEEIPTINLTTNINTNAHDVYQRIQIEATEPLASFDLNQISLFALVDTVKTKIPITVEKDSNSVRKFYIEQKWIPERTYVFQIDSAAARNLYGYPSNKVDLKYKIQKESYYGKINLNITGIDVSAIVQLLSNNKDEKVLKAFRIDGPGKVEFPYLKPDKYRIRMILDENKNGKWDTGYLAEELQPEKVIYFQKILKTKSNFEVKENWDAVYKPDFKKELLDEDAEKTKKKELQRKAATR